MQFYCQKPIGDYIVDFYAPKARLVVEVDGPQHLEKAHSEKDCLRDKDLQARGLLVLRFNNLEVLQKTESVLREVYRIVKERAAGDIPAGNPP